MQHKSLFAALLCGALCLTACLKNEESPSVTQVRNAKAHELESIAELNKAQATATITLANAQAKLLEAEAKLTEANAKIAEAQAKKVDAETALLVVEAKLQEVYVQIANVELEGKIAELEALKAQYKAEIAAAEAAEAYWQGVKDQVATELEIEAAQLEAALVNAQAEVAEAAANYAALLDQIEEELAQEEREDLAELRDRIAALSDEYTEAALDLIEMKGALYEANVMKAGLESGIIDLQDAKNAKTEKNNNEIARIQKYEEYLETYREASVEEIKDQSVDAIIEYNKASDEWNAAEAEATSLKTAWHELKTQVGYTYENKFDQEGVQLFAESDTYYTLPAIADMVGAKVVRDEETGARKHIYTYEEIIDEETGETEAKEVVLYTEHKTVKTPFSYPELPEGIDNVSPRIMETMSDEERVIYPLTVSKEGYQTVVDHQIAAAELFRDNNVARIQKKIDCMQEFIDYYAKPVGEYTEGLKALEEAAAEAKAAVQPAKDAWVAAMRVWGQENEIANMMEIQALVDDYLALLNEAEEYIEDFKYEGMDVYDIEAAMEFNDYMIEWANAYMAGTWEGEGYDGNQHDFDPYYDEEFEGYDPDEDWDVFDDYTYRELLVQLETAEYRLKEANSAVTTAQTEYNTAETAYNNQAGTVSAKLAAVEAAVDALYQARKDLASDPTNADKQTAVQTAQDNYEDALDDYTTELGKLDDTALNTAKDNLTAAQNAATKAEAIRDHYKAAVDYVENGPAEWAAENEALQAVLDEYEETINGYTDELNDMLLEWNSMYDYFLESESGEAALAAYEEYADARSAYQDALDELNAFKELYAHKYVFNENALYGYFDTFDDIVADKGEEPDEDDYDDYFDYLVAWYDWYYSYDQKEELEGFWYYYDIDDLYIDYGFPESYEFYQENQNYAYYLSVSNLKALSDEFAEMIKGLNAQIEAVNEKAADQIARINTIMDLYDDVTATQDVYFEGMEELNNIWAEYVVAKKAAFDKKLVMDEREAECDALHVLLVNTEALDAQIAACEAQIAALKKEIATLEDQIKTSEDLIAIMLNPAIALLEEQIEVYEQLVASLKAELNEALAELNN